MNFYSRLISLYFVLWLLSGTGASWARLLTLASDVLILEAEEALSLSWTRKVLYLLVEPPPPLRLAGPDPDLTLLGAFRLEASKLVTMLLDADLFFEAGDLTLDGGRSAMEPVPDRTITEDSCSLFARYLRYSGTSSSARPIGGSLRLDWRLSRCCLESLCAVYRVARRS